MKGWKVDELGLARWLGGKRRPQRVCDVQAGRWRFDVRRRERLACAAWLARLEEAAGAERCAVAVHVVQAGRWVVVCDLDAFRALLKQAGELDSSP